MICPILPMRIRRFNNACTFYLIKFIFCIKKYFNLIPIVSNGLHDNSDDIMEYFSDPEIIHQQYENMVDMVVDGGHGNIYASTVLDCSEDDIVVLREGIGSLDVLN